MPAVSNDNYGHTSFRVLLRIIDIFTVKAVSPTNLWLGAVTNYAR
jgi:hypothetical protein